MKIRKGTCGLSKVLRYPETEAGLVYTCSKVAYQGQYLMRVADPAVTGSANPSRYRGRFVDIATGKMTRPTPLMSAAVFTLVEDVEVCIPDA